MKFIVFIGLVTTGCINQLGGAFKYPPDHMQTGLSASAQKLLVQSQRDLTTTAIRDVHTHVVGLGTGNSGAFIHEDMQSLLHPMRRFRFAVYMSAAGVANLAQADDAYMARLVELVRNTGHQGKYYLLAFDKHYNRDGNVDLTQTEFYTPNEYVFALAEKYPDYFIPAISVHPYRPDAISELEKWAKKGARLIKWLPSAMGIDPADERCDPFYQKVKELNMVILTHAGEEKAVEAENAQALGNPLLLRKPLDMGLKIVVAHCASLGYDIDFDDPKKPLVPSFELFLRLMDTPKYQGLLFGELSATIQRNRMHVLETLLERKDLHSRLVNGSDYPLPAVNSLIRTGKLMDAGFLSSEERDAINEIYSYNPLLFDFVLKRTLKSPKTGAQFSPDIFVSNANLGL